MRKRKAIYRIMILMLAVAAIVYGVVRQEHIVVWKKAINICMECIGVG